MLHRIISIIGMIAHSRWLEVAKATTEAQRPLQLACIRTATVNVRMRRGWMERICTADVASHHVSIRVIRMAGNHAPMARLARSRHGADRSARDGGVQSVSRGLIGALRCACCCCSLASMHADSMLEESRSPRPTPVRPRHAARALTATLEGSPLSASIRSTSRAIAANSSAQPLLARCACNFSAASRTRAGARQARPARTARPAWRARRTPTSLPKEARHAPLALPPRLQHVA